MSLFEFLCVNYVSTVLLCSVCTVIFMIAACILRGDGLKRGRARFRSLLVIFHECIVLVIRLIAFVF